MLKFLECIETALWILLLAGVPLAIVPSGYESYLLPKMLWVQGIVLVLGGIASILTLLGRPFRLALSLPLAFLFLYAALQAASRWWAASPSLARDQGNFWLIVALGAVLFQNAFWSRPRRLLILAWAFIAGATLTAVWALSQDFLAVFRPGSARVVNKLGDWRGLIAAGFGNTSHISDSLALAFPVLFLGLMRARGAISIVLWSALLALSYGALIVCFSVHSNAGLILGMGILLVLLWRRGGWSWFRRRIGRLLFISVVWLAIALFFSFDLPGNPHRPGIFKQAFSSDRLHFGWDSRIYIWRTALQMIVLKSWTGFGAGNFVFVFPGITVPFGYADPGQYNMGGAWTNAAHNSFLQSWTEIGIPGPALLFLIFTLTFRDLGRGQRVGRGFEAHGRFAAIAALAAFAIHAQMNFPLEMAWPSVILAAIVALSAAIAPRAPVELRFPDYCLEYPWGRFVIELKSMTRPSALRLELAFPRVAAAPAAVLVLALLAWFPLRALASEQSSDLAYRQAAEARDQAFALQESPNSPPDVVEEAFHSADALFIRALSLWPNHHDCRSAYTEFLLRWGKGQAALEQADIVLRRLNAWEAHLRRARALILAGKLDDARREAQVTFRMRPIEGDRRRGASTWAEGYEEWNPRAARDLGVPFEAEETGL